MVARVVPTRPGILRTSRSTSIRYYSAWTSLVAATWRLDSRISFGCPRSRHWLVRALALGGPHIAGPTRPAPRRVPARLPGMTHSCHASAEPSRLARHLASRVTKPNQINGSPARDAQAGRSIRPRKGDNLVLFAVVGPEILPVKRQRPRGKWDADKIVHLRR